MADENKTITLTKKEYDSRMNTMTMVGSGMGLIVAGLTELTENKVNRNNFRMWGFVGAGAFVIGLAVVFRKIDKMDEPSEKKLGADGSNEKSSSMAISPVFGGYGEMNCYKRDVRGKKIPASCGFELDL